MKRAISSRPRPPGFWKLALATALWAGVQPVAVLAQAAPSTEPTAQADAEAASDGGALASERESWAKAKLTILPVPIVDPTIGNGLAAVALYTFPSPGSETGQPRSTLGIGAAYTNSKTYAIGAGGSVHFLNDRIRVAGSAFYADANILFYGTGGNSLVADDPVPLNVSGAFAHLSAKIRIAPHLYAGGAMTVIDGKLNVERRIDELPDLSVSYRQIAIGPVAEYDTRDNSWWPTKGAMVSGQYLFYLDSEPFFKAPAGVGGAFSKLEAKASAYVSLRPNLVLAGQVRTSSATSETPFFLLPSISLRGFPGGRYLDSFVLQGQGEARWMFRPRLGVVAFGGIGVIASGFAEIDHGHSAVGYGVGLRYLISPADRMHVGLDVAFGGDGATLYFRVGEAF